VGRRFGISERLALRFSARGRRAAPDGKVKASKREPQAADFSVTPAAFVCVSKPITERIGMVPPSRSAIGNVVFSHHA